jgi:hypothetical protein
MATKGRPAGKTQTTPMNMRVSAEFLAMLDGWRRAQPDLPTRTEAIRRIVEQFLAGASEASDGDRPAVPPKKAKPVKKAKPAPEKPAGPRKSAKATKAAPAKTARPRRP